MADKPIENTEKMSRVIGLAKQATGRAGSDLRNTLTNHPKMVEQLHTILLDTYKSVQQVFESVEKPKDSK